MNLYDEWTPARLEKARTLYIEGLSAGAIARALGGTTRNAVIGQATRRKWNEVAKRPLPAMAKAAAPKRAERLRLTEEKRAALAPARPKAVMKPVGGRGFVAALPAPQIVPSPAEACMVQAIAAGRGIALADLREGYCRFPLWPNGLRAPDPSAQFYCGRPVQQETSSWCGPCAARVHAPYALAHRTPRPSHLRS